MVNLKTKFIGLELKSPIIAGSCGLTSEVSKIAEIALSGAGAIVLKSIFEEQINMVLPVPEIPCKIIMRQAPMEATK